MDLHLKDRVVLITGATGGIGQALTRAFAAEGCKLAISSTSQAKLDAFTPSLGLDEGHLKTFIVDVTREEQVKAFVDGAHAAYGRLDVHDPPHRGEHAGQARRRGRVCQPIPGRPLLPPRRGGRPGAVPGGGGRFLFDRAGH